MNDSDKSWQIFTIPNILSMLRVISIGPIIYCILQEDRTLITIGIILIIFAIATDYFDGILARRLNQISEVGKLLDPLADKIAIATLIVLLTIYKGLPIWIAIFIIGRDILIIIFGIFWIAKFKNVSTSNSIGKWTVFFIALMIVAYIIEIDILEQILTWNAIFFILLSGIFYIVRLYKLLKNNPIEKQ